MKDSIVQIKAKMQSEENIKRKWVKMQYYLGFLLEDVCWFLIKFVLEATLPLSLKHNNSFSSLHLFISTGDRAGLKKQKQKTKKNYPPKKTKTKTLRKENKLNKRSHVPEEQASAVLWRRFYSEIPTGLGG